MVWTVTRARPRSTRVATTRVLARLRSRPRSSCLAADRSLPDAHPSGRPEAANVGLAQNDLGQLGARQGVVASGDGVCVGEKRSAGSLTPHRRPGVRDRRFRQRGRRRWPGGRRRRVGEASRGPPPARPARGPGHTRQRPWLARSAPDGGQPCGVSPRRREELARRGSTCSTRRWPPVLGCSTGPSPPSGRSARCTRPARFARRASARQLAARDIRSRLRSIRRLRRARSSAASDAGRRRPRPPAP